MTSKFFSSFQTRTDALKRSTTRWADEEGDDNYPLSQAYVHSNAPLSEHEVSPDEDHVESPKMKFGSISSKLGNKINSEASSVFGNRPMGTLLRHSSQKEVKPPILKSGTFNIKPKIPEQQTPSQDLSAILAKLSSMENKITSFVDGKISALEKKLEASEKRATSTTKAIESIGTLMEGLIVEGLKVSRGDLEHAIALINDCTKESGGILATSIEEISEKVTNMGSRTAHNNVDENFQLDSNEVIVITANNPHDTTHRVSAEELMTVIEGNKVYVASSIDEFKRDLSMIRDADLAEEQDATAEEI